MVRPARKLSRHHRAERASLLFLATGVRRGSRRSVVAAGERDSFYNAGRDLLTKRRPRYRRPDSSGGSEWALDRVSSACWGRSNGRSTVRTRSWRPSSRRSTASPSTRRCRYGSGAPAVPGGPPVPGGPLRAGGDGGVRRVHDPHLGYRAEPYRAAPGGLGRSVRDRLGTGLPGSVPAPRARRGHRPALTETSPPAGPLGLARVVLWMSEPTSRRTPAAFSPN